jgi:hypothetical protein
MWENVRSMACRCAPALALLAVWQLARWEAGPRGPFQETFYIAPDGEVVKLFSTMERSAPAAAGDDAAEVVAIEPRETAG